MSLVSVFSEKRFTATLRAEILAGLDHIRNCGLKTGTGKIQIARLKREDWAESWKKHFKAPEIGNRLAGETQLDQTPATNRPSR